MLDLPDGGSTQVELEISSDCSADVALCALGTATVDFRLFGNSEVDIHARPQSGERQIINQRTMGVFAYQTEPDANVPPLYYDVRFEIVDARQGERAFSGQGELAPNLVMLGELTQTRQKWVQQADLSEGMKIGRIYIQPVFDGGSSLETLNIAAPGVYTASLELLVTTR